MKIAIIAPSPVPFTIGGAENLWWGLLNWINQNTNHQAELIKIPSPERNFRELVSSSQVREVLPAQVVDCLRCR